MEDYKEVTGTIEVPPNTGVKGFLRTIEEILRKPRVQSIEIDSRGQVTFRRFARNGEDYGSRDNNFGVDLKSLQPWHIIRNGRIQECSLDESLPAAVVVGLMFDKAAQDQLRPLAFATGADSVLWEWYRFTTGCTLDVRDQFFGLPLLRDRQLPDTVLLLCVGYGRDAAFIDTQVSYKVEMPRYEAPTTDVQVIS